jgi:hypothetical protein
VLGIEADRFLVTGHRLFGSALPIEDDGGGCRVDEIRVDYEFQRGGNAMLRIKRENG